jgi:TM2 domain-containing membrane protein YozV
MKIFQFIILFLATSTISYANYPVKKANVENNETIEVVVYDDADATLARKSQQTALILCVFLGGIGVHRYYLGDTWQGIVQTLTLGGLGIWSTIDLIRLITGALGPGW